MSLQSHLLIDVAARLGLPTPGHELVEGLDAEKILGRVAAARLGWVLKRARLSAEEKYYTLESLLRKIEPESVDDLVLLLGSLVRRGILEKKYRVHSPVTHGGIGDFDYEKIPREVKDETTGMLVEVGPENLEIVFHAIAPKRT